MIIPWRSDQKFFEISPCLLDFYAFLTMVEETTQFYQVPQFHHGFAVSPLIPHGHLNDASNMWRADGEGSWEICSPTTKDSHGNIGQRLGFRHTKRKPLSSCRDNHQIMSRPGRTSLFPQNVVKILSEVYPQGAKLLEEEPQLPTLWPFRMGIPCLSLSLSLSRSSMCMMRMCV